MLKPSDIQPTQLTPALEAYIDRKLEEAGGIYPCRVPHPPVQAYPPAELNEARRRYEANGWYIVAPASGSVMWEMSPAAGRRRTFYMEGVPLTGDFLRQVADRYIRNARDEVDECEEDTGGLRPDTMICLAQILEAAMNEIP